jgi:bla regulator protein blaR1
MARRVTHNSGFSRKLLVSLAKLLAMVAAIAFGLVSAVQSRARSQAQSPSAAMPAFEVVAIKPDKDASGVHKFGWFSPGTFTATGASVQFLIQEAYRVEDTRVFGAPKWLKSERYEIKAKVPSDVAEELRKLDSVQQYDQRIAVESSLLQTLLKDRFKLALHRETKEFPMFALVVAKNGPKLHEAKPDDTYPDGIKDLEGRGHGHVMRMVRGELIGQGIPISDLIEMLGGLRFGLIVVDKTGLTGKYDFTLRWTPDERAPSKKIGSEPMPGNAPPSDSSGPSIFTAIQEQLGLKLERQKGPVEILVIDHVERPSEN